MSELTFARMPKTGGIWLREFVTPDFYFDRTAEYNYGVYRDPVDWYQSWLSFSYSGSEVMMHVFDPIASIIDGPITVEKYINTILYPKSEMKDIYMEHAKATFMFGEKTVKSVIDDWVDSGLDFYSHLVQERLTDVRHVVDYNGLQENVAALADLHGEDEAAKLIRGSWPINITNKKVTLSPELIEKIRDVTAGTHEEYTNRMRKPHYDL